ncbi:NACHT, LRR and PYD domains-containing protein 1b allele 2 [Lates calcarifer]|uniref:NACHT, LRR and PYD domains-containing protein 1b allele 2 n=2 Tax=Lates calcarifer TaxID=8187 RepID=A0AAJ7V9T6_LATCA|nr:NACHT, LRR and PYD domains-containing protein 1b allele 2 [Lates calcarifer]
MSSFSAGGAPVRLTGVQKMSDCVEEEDRAESPGSSCLSMKINAEPGHSELDDGEKGTTSDRHKEHSSTSNTNQDMPESREDELCPERLKQQQQALTGPKELIPEVWTESGNTSYRFRCPGPGGFQCSSTRLVFVVDQEAELLYRTVPWDESLLQSAGKTPAGPLFNIQCPEAAVCELHLPHCETQDAVIHEDLLSVVHITDDGLSFLKPLQITDTHVIVRVPHLSSFGLVWAVELLGRIWNYRKPVSSKVLLFLRPPNPKTQRQNLNVFLLPRNVPLDEVKAKHRNSEHIMTPSYCRLITGQRYSVQCGKAQKVQPERAEFDLDLGPDYLPTFEIRLPINTEEATVTVRDQKDKDVWKHDVDLSDSLQSKENQPEPRSLSPEKRLFSVRSQFVDAVSDPVLNKMLDQLLQQDIINDEEKDSVATKTKADKARTLIDMVRKKGARASSDVIKLIRKLDVHLSEKLHLS